MVSTFKDFVISILYLNCMQRSLFQPSQWKLLSLFALQLEMKSHSDKLNMHCINEHKALFDPTFLQARLNLRGDVYKCPAGGHLKP